MILEVRKTILIVEDEAPLCSALRDKLSREGFSTLEARNGEDGLVIALRDHPDLILLDILMPKMDGGTMLRRMREESEWGMVVPVIVLTNLTNVKEKHLSDINEGSPTQCIRKTDVSIGDIVIMIRDDLKIGF